MTNRIFRMVKQVSESIDRAIDVSCMRVTGPEQVKQRDRLTLGYLYQGFRNAGRQLSRGVYNVIMVASIYEAARSVNLIAIDDTNPLEGKLTT